MQHRIAKHEDKTSGVFIRSLSLTNLSTLAAVYYSF